MARWYAPASSKANTTGTNTTTMTNSSTSSTANCSSISKIARWDPAWYRSHPARAWWSQRACRIARALRAAASSSWWKTPGSFPPATSLLPAQYPFADLLGQRFGIVRETGPSPIGQQLQQRLEAPPLPMLDHWKAQRVGHHIRHVHQVDHAEWIGFERLMMPGHHLPQLGGKRRLLQQPRACLAVIHFEKVLLHGQQVERVIFRNREHIGIGFRIFHQQCDSADVANQTGHVREVRIHLAGARRFLDRKSTRLNSS